ncbi:uncharacterized protein LOC142750502 [Rhinoderma darwinii]|uniref:uncharacterized protein LOC142750502 n=1 Tax=Rhinoderma darwinii TaxID=43563 RepID=UPI003F66A9B2
MSDCMNQYLPRVNGPFDFTVKDMKNRLTATNANRIAGFEFEKKKKLSCLQSVISQVRVKTDDCDYCDFSGFGLHFVGATTASETMWIGHSASIGSAYMNITPEEHLRRLGYCIKLLPSPLYKMERLMPTNPEAQNFFLIQEEEQPRPSMEITERQERSMMMRELCKYLEEEEKESTEENSKIRRKKIQRVKTIKIKNSTRRSRIRQNTIRQYVDQHMRGKRNILWTILLNPLCR